MSNMSDLFLFISFDLYVSLPFVLSIVSYCDLFVMFSFEIKLYTNYRGCSFCIYAVKYGVF